MKLDIAKPISQRNSSWSKYFINNSSYSIENYGCLITTISHYLKSIGENYDPQNLNEYISKNDGYEGALFKWGTLPGGSKIKYKSIRYVGVDTPDSFFTKLKKDLNEGYYPILEIDFDPTKKNQQMHFVGVIGYLEKDGNTDYRIMDPWTGTEVSLLSYGDPKKSVYSYKTYSTKLKLLKEEPSAEQLKIEQLESYIKGLESQIISLRSENAIVYTGVQSRDVRIEELETHIKQMQESGFSVQEACVVLGNALFNDFIRVIGKKRNSSS